MVLALAARREMRCACRGRGDRVLSSDQTEAVVTDRKCLRSMIPHHAGAILKCKKARVQGSDIKTLCNGIISSQESEIKEMKSMLAR